MSIFQLLTFNRNVTCFYGKSELLQQSTACLTHRSFVADAALHHMLVRLALHRYGALTDPAADDRSAAAVGAALR